MHTHFWAMGRIFPKQRINTRRPEPWILLLDLFHLLLQSLVVTRMRLVAGAGTAYFYQPAGFALGQAAFCGLHDYRSRFRERVGGFSYFLRFYWGLEDFLDDVDL